MLERVIDPPKEHSKPRRKPPSAGKGRKKGEPNKITRDVREMIALVAEKNAAKLDGWLARIGRKNPAQAMELYLRMIEYHIPKLSRQEIVKPDSGPPRILNSSQLTAEQREQLRLMLAQSDPALIEQQKTEPVGLAVAQVVDSTGDEQV
jgi:hypothetical protein